MITRKDISAGYQAVQSMHALIQFNVEHKQIAREWFENSNYLCLLSVADEKELENIIASAKDLNIIFSIFREPDLNNQITAIALSPCRESKQLCSKFSLALQDI